MVESFGVHWLPLHLRTAGVKMPYNPRCSRPRGYSPSPRPAAGYLRGAELDAAVQWVDLSGGIVVKMRGGAMGVLGGGWGPGRGGWIRWQERATAPRDSTGLRFDGIFPAPPRDSRGGAG